jgi:hypothetical protein
MIRFRKMFATIFRKFRAQSTQKKIAERARVPTNSTSEYEKATFDRTAVFGGLTHW